MVLVEVQISSRDRNDEKQSRDVASAIILDHENQIHSFVTDSRG